MAIQFPSGFKITSREPIDTRLVLTLEQMRTAHLDLAMPDVYYAICSDNSKIYIYNKANTADAVSGKFRVLDSAIPISDTETINVEVDPSNNTRYIISIAGKEAAPTQAVLRKHIDEDGNTSYSWDVIYDKEEVDKLLEDKVAAKEGYSLISDEDLKKIQDLPEKIVTVEASEQNGNIKIDGEEVTVYKEAEDVVHDEHYQHTDNNFTDVLKDKLAGIAAGADVSPVKAIQVAVKDNEYSSVVGVDGIARINLSDKQDVIDYQHPVNLDYTKESDTKKHFTYAEKTKLAGIEAGAQANIVEDVQVKNSADEEFVSVVEDKTVKIDLSKKQDTIDTSNPLSIEAVQDSAAYKRMTVAEREKLAAIEIGAEKNAIVDIKVNEQSVVTDKVAKITYETSLDKDSSNAPSATAVRQFVNSSLENNVANYVTSDAAGNNFASVAALKSSLRYYYNGAEYTPKKNDYAIVAKDENHEDKQARYIYSESTWNFLYTVSNTLTAGQQAAVDSGITSEHVTKLNNLPSDAERNVIEIININGVNIPPDNARKVSFTIPTGVLAQLDQITEQYLAQTIVTKLNQAHGHNNIDLLNSLTASQLLTAAQIEQINKVSGKQDLLGFTGTYNKESNKVVTADTLAAEILRTSQTLEGKINAVQSFKYAISATKPEAKKENMGTIWLVPMGAGADAYNEYIVLEISASEYQTELLGNTRVDLSNYYNKSEIAGLLNDKVDKVQGHSLVSDTEWANTKQAVVDLNEEIQEVRAIAEAGENTIETIEVVGAEVSKVNKKVTITINTSNFITKDTFDPTKYTKTDDLAKVAISNDYADLDNTPVIPAEVTENTVTGWGFSKLPTAAGNNKVLKVIDGNTAWSEVTMDKTFITEFALGNLPKGTEIKATDTIKDILFKILRGALLESLEFDIDDIDTIVFVGESFNAPSLVVTGHYDDNTTMQITDYDTSPDVITKETKFITVAAEGETVDIPVTTKARVNGAFEGCTVDSDYQEILVGDTYQVTLATKAGYKALTADNFSVISGDGYTSAAFSGNTLFITNIVGPISYTVKAEAIKYASIANITNGTAKFSNSSYILGQNGWCEITPINTTFGKPTSVTVTGATQTGYDTTTGRVTFTVDGSAENITVVANCEEFRLTSLAITEDSTANTYKVGDRPNLTGIKLTAYYENGATKSLVFGTDTGLTSTPAVTDVFTDADLGSKAIIIRYTNSVGSAASVTKYVTVEPRVIVPEVPVTSITIEPESASLFKGESINLVATAQPDDASIQLIDWAVDAEEDVVTLNYVPGSNTCKVTAATYNGGTTAGVVASSTDGSEKNDTCVITIADDYYIGYVDNITKATFRTLTTEEGATQLVANATAKTREDSVTETINGITTNFAFKWVAPTNGSGKGVFYAMIPVENLIEFTNGMLISGGLTTAYSGTNWTNITECANVTINGKVYGVYGLYINGWNGGLDTVYMNIKVNEI